jgi:hypothetical protein
MTPTPPRGGIGATGQRSTARVSANPPSLLLHVELEGVPRVIILPAPWEDEMRLRLAWTHPATRARILQSVADALERLAEGRAA